MRALYEDWPRRYPLSVAQREVWASARSAPASCAYNDAYVIRFRGRLDAQRLVAAVHALVHRHESLRMRFVDDGPSLDGIAAIIDPGPPIVVPTLDAGELAADEFALYERRFVEDFAREPFDLAAGPPIRAALLRFRADAHVLVLVAHHIVFDHWSFGVLMRELAAFYVAARRGERAALMPLQSGYGGWLMLEAARSARYAPGPVRAVLPTDRGAVAVMRLPAAVVERAAQFGAALRATPFMVLLAAFWQLLEPVVAPAGARVDIAIGGRIEADPLIGLFARRLPLRIPVARERDFPALLGDVRVALLELLARAGRPDRAQPGDAPIGGGPAPLTVVIADYPAPAPAQWLPGLAVSGEEAFLGTTRFDLDIALQPRPGGALVCRITYRRDRFEPAAIDALGARYCELLESVIGDPPPAPASV